MKISGSKLASLVLALLISGLGMGLAQSNSQLTVAIWSDLPGFDPHGLTTAVPAQVYPNIFDRLLFRDAAGELVPSLATEWRNESDTAWRFVLRDDVLWHDGQPFTAADVKFSLERLAFDDSLPRHAQYSTISGVEVVSDYEVVINTQGPDPILLNRLAAGGGEILPKHYFESVPYETFVAQPIGTGPYKFVRHVPDAALELEAFADHWRGQAPFTSLRFRIIPEATTAVSELLAGGVDIVARVEAPDMPRLENRDDIVLLPVPAPRHVVWYLNTDESVATGDIRVRRAIDYAIDSQLIIDAVLGGFGTPTRARVAPGLTGAPMEHYGNYNYDPELAKELLAEAGYGPGELSIKIHAFGPSEQVEVMAAMLEAVGINAQVIMIEQTSYATRMWDNGEFEHMAYASVGNALFDYTSALQVLSCPDGSHHRRGGWCDEEYSAIVRELQTEMDVAKREELYAAATDILLEELPQIYPYTIERIAATRASVDWTPRQDESWWMFEATPR